MQLGYTDALTITSLSHVIAHSVKIKKKHGVLDLQNTSSRSLDDVDYDTNLIDTPCRSALWRD